MTNLASKYIYLGTMGHAYIDYLSLLRVCTETIK